MTLINFEPFQPSGRYTSGVTSTTPSPDGTAAPAAGAPVPAGTQTSFSAADAVAGKVPPLTLTAAQVADCAFAAGFRGDSLRMAVAIAQAESLFNAYAAGQNGDGSIDRGLWQVNNKFHPEWTDAQCFDPATCAKAAYAISNGGTNWKPWSTFNSGKYLTYYNEQAVVNAAQGATGTMLVSASNTVGGSSPTAGFAGTLVQGTGPLVASASSAGGSGDGLVASFAPVLQVTGLKITPCPIPIQQLMEAISEVSVDLAADKVGQITIKVNDPGLALFKKFNLDIAGIGQIINLEDMKQASAYRMVDVDFAGNHMVLSAFDVDLGQANGEFVLYCRDRAAERLKRVRSGADVNQDGLVPSSTGLQFNPNGATSIFANFAQQVGADFVGQEVSALAPAPVRQGFASSISPLDVESDWDIGNSYAGQVGYWWFCSDNTIFFGQPSKIAPQVVSFNVGWNSGFAGHPEWDALEVPQCHYTADTYPPYRTIMVKLPPQRGQQVKPGMKMTMQGLGPIFDIDYLVTNVTFDVDGGATPVEIKAQEPVDPIPQDVNMQDQFFNGGQAPGTSAAPAQGSKQASDIVSFAQSQLGKAYVYGAHPAPSDPNPADFDCSGLVAWACGQAGVSFAGSSGQMYAAIVAAKLTCTPDKAKNTNGALFFTGPGGQDHVGISKGDGSTVEAVGGGGIHSVVNLTWGADGSDMVCGYIPGVNYSGKSPVVGPPTGPTVPSMPPISPPGTSPDLPGQGPGTRP